MERVNRLFENIWRDYTKRLCPTAHEIHGLLEEGEPLVNDHIALRTFSLPKVSLARLSAPFLALGYQSKGQYHFEAKKLYAEHLEHPDPLVPKVFISELRIGLCSPQLQQHVRKLVAQVPDALFDNEAFLYSGRPWALDSEVYHALAAESEYAGWVAAHGYGANHFTVNVNQLELFPEVAEVNHLLRHNGFAINEAGGEIKGTPEVMLEQSSTMADKVEVVFNDTSLLIPGGFYEFAKRYPMSDGELYQGFVTASADRIFESTNQS